MREVFRTDAARKRDKKQEEAKRREKEEAKKKLYTRFTPPHLDPLEDDWYND